MILSLVSFGGPRQLAPEVFALLGCGDDLGLGFEHGQKLRLDVLGGSLEAESLDHLAKLRIGKRATRLADTRTPWRAVSDWHGSSGRGVKDEVLHVAPVMSERPGSMPSDPKIMTQPAAKTN